MKKVLAATSTILISLALLVAPTLHASASCASAEAFGDGDGLTANTAFEISTAGNLLELRSQTAANATAGKFYRLTTDIDFQNCPYTAPAGATPFKGHIEGSNFSISNMTISGSSYQGLFGAVQEGTIQNLVLKNFSVTSTGPFAGALVGYAQSFGGNQQVIDNVSVEDSTVSSSSSYSGGILGYASAMELGNLRVTNTTVNSTGLYTGGIVGAAFNGTSNTISGLVATGATVSGAQGVGGLIGYIHLYPTMTKSGFFAGTVSRAAVYPSPVWFGGLVGLVEPNFVASELAFRGKVDTSAGDATQVGMIFGETLGSISISDSYARGTVVVANSTTVPAGLVGAQSIALNLTDNYVEMTATDDSNPAVQVSARPFGDLLGTVTDSYFNSESHLAWLDAPSSSARTSAELIDASNFANWSITSNSAQVSSGGATEIWYQDVQLDRGHPFLTWEYLNQNIVPCEPGRFSATGIGDCDPVPVGSFTAFTGMLEAELCPVGYFQPATGSSSCLPAQPGNFVEASGQISSTLCPPGTYQPGTAASSCLLADPGYYVPQPGASSQLRCPFGTTSAAQASACVGLPTYEGPSVFNALGQSFAPGDRVELLGEKLESVSTISIDDIEMDFSCTATKCSFLLPTGLTPGLKDLKIRSDYGTLVVQSAIRVVRGESDSEVVEVLVSTIADSQAKVHMFNVVGAGKLQLMLNGEEYAWINATSEEDPRLRFISRGSYFVRTVNLASGENIIEVLLEGEMISRAMLEG